MPSDTGSVLTCICHLHHFPAKGISPLFILLCDLLHGLGHFMSFFFMEGILAFQYFDLAAQLFRADLQKMRVFTSPVSCQLMRIHIRTDDYDRMHRQRGGDRPRADPVQILFQDPQALLILAHRIADHMRTS